MTSSKRDGQGPTAAGQSPGHPVELLELPVELNTFRRLDSHPPGLVLFTAAIAGYNRPATSTAIR